MIALLKYSFVKHLNNNKTHLPPVPYQNLKIKFEDSDEIYFDIIDKQSNCICPRGRGNATYHNPQQIHIRVIDYEYFVDLFPFDHIKGIKKCDFITYSTNNQSFFILNELSYGKRDNKFSDARKQLHNSLKHLNSINDIKNFLLQFTKRNCIFSNRSLPISTPNGMADAFGAINKVLTFPLKHDYQPITKLGFEFLETDNIQI